MSEQNEEQTIEDALTGWTIYAIDYDRTVEGGMVFHLIQGNVRKIVVMGFTELGNWLEREEKFDV